ncbi:MAG: M64 family metallo-endopeptidase [Candidatus Aminicenantes bacterium]|nr:M64 family metallo-endopeptidase [Candidatus Aminicenantes bacterium]
MKTFFGAALILALVVVPNFGKTDPDFDRYFVDQTMRIDYFHIGNLQEEIVTLDRVLVQGTWAGSTKNLIDPFDLGRYSVKIYDDASGTLLFSRGFDSYFGEYRTTEEAAKGIRRTFHESALIPLPKAKVRFVLESRDRDNVLHRVFEQVIDPASIEVLRKPLMSGVKVFELLKSGDPHVKADLAFVAEGYSLAEEAKLRADLDRFLKVFLKQEPYGSLRDKFNLYGVWKPSDESGCDEPGHGTYKSTAVSATFDSLGSERYVLTEDNKALRDIAAHVPYDALAIMINHKRYGGGGIYNAFCTFTVDNQWYEYLFPHEFGHSFTGLADEYYTSSVAYNEFYPAGVEPREANITALLDPANLKWKNLVTPGTAVPTPWEKEEFDKSDMAYQKVRGEINEKIAQMKRSGAPADEVARLEEESERLSKAQADWVDHYLASSKFAGKTGAFEGAGYAAKGLYRSAVDCIMFTKGAKPYCPVCEQAVRRMIQFYSE